MRIRRTKAPGPRLDSRFSRAGLSLLEAIISTGIFVAAMAIIGQLLQIGLLASHSNRQSTIALLRCESKLAEFVTGIESLELAGEAVPFPDDMNWQWTAEVEPTQVTGLIRLAVTIEHLNEAGDPDHECRLTQLITDPAIRNQLFAGETLEGERTPITMRRMLGLDNPSSDTEGP